MKTEKMTKYGIGLLRISLGIMFLAHSIVLKLLTFGLDLDLTRFHGQFELLH